MPISIETRRNTEISVQHDMGRLLPSGTSRVHIDSRRAELGLGTNKSDAPKNRAVIQKNRQRSHLEKEFFVKDRPDNHPTRQFYIKQLPDAGRVAMVGQPAGYFEKCGLVIATNLPHEPEFTDSTVQTILPVDLPNYTGVAFTAAKLAALQTADALATTDQKAIVIEHITPEVSTPECKYPRSVPLPHASFGLVDLDSIEPERTRYAHLDAEQKVLLHKSGVISLMALHMYSYIHTALQETDFDANKFDVVPRSEEPFGYTIQYDIHSDALTRKENVLFVSAVLQAQQDAVHEFGSYVQGVLPCVVNYGDESFQLKPQPASRDYMHIDKDGYLATIKSPIYYSHAGGIEASGVVLYRNPDIVPVHSADAITAFRKRAGDNISDAVDTVVQTAA